MCNSLPERPESEALRRWLWSARWQLTRFALDGYARYGRGITVVRTRTVPVVRPGAESVIPPGKLAYYTSDAMREMKPTRRVNARDLEGWMNLAELYDPTKQEIRAVLAGNLSTIVSIGPLTTLAREARSRFSEALTVRPLGLDVVRQAARVYYDELVAAGCTGSEIEAKGREGMWGYRYCFTHYDKAPLFGLQVAAAIAEGFGIDWRLAKDESAPA